MGLGVFALSAFVSLAASVLLVSRLERVGERLGASEALLGLIAALAADGPEITSSVTAIAGGHGAVGVGVTLGSNVFNLAALLGLSAVVAGRISDRSGRRKIYVVWSTVVMASSAVILAFFPVFPAAMVAALILGLGYGIYLAVDQALVTQVLPTAVDRGRDLGVINIANAAPQVLAPVIAAPIVTGATGYTGLYLLTAAITLLSAVLVTRIRSVP